MYFLCFSLAQSNHQNGPLAGNRTQTEANLGHLKNTCIINPALSDIPGGLVVRIRRSHRRGRGSIPRLGSMFFFVCFLPQLPFEGQNEGMRMF